METDQSRGSRGARPRNAVRDETGARVARHGRSPAISIGADPWCIRAGEGRSRDHGPRRCVQDLQRAGSGGAPRVRGFAFLMARRPAAAGASSRSHRQRAQEEKAFQPTNYSKLTDSNNCVFFLVLTDNNSCFSLDSPPSCALCGSLRAIALSAIADMLITSQFVTQALKSKRSFPARCLSRNPWRRVSCIAITEKETTLRPGSAFIQQVRR
jgi:hypothetical protein